MARIVLGLVGGVALPWIAVSGLTSVAAVPAAPGLLFALGAVVAAGGELIERRLFFLASVAPRMPGMAR
jgi:hypothetical protein